MKSLLTLTIVLALAAATAQAAYVTDPAQGALKLRLQFDLAGNATLTNITAAAVAIDGYEIDSSGGLLDPTGWVSIADVVAAGQYQLVIDNLGAGALQFGELTAQTSVVAEGNTSSHGTFQPGAPWGIGKPSTAPSLTDLKFWYSMPGEVNKMFLGTIEIVPEPGSAVLLLVGSVVVFRRRCRKVGAPFSLLRRGRPATLSLLALGLCVPALRRRRSSAFSAGPRAQQKRS